ncbi:hypothetical protein HHK36_005902 [Tetracentron sinense]|uniref:C2H2-type domain-containing protein n=1 Tax=Tetracentron sinense TaxID=13715 RepID=A0A834ZR86_TETSI|nr:hypothetical protein HHK36_005902 [Tetracentron sinense]
MREDQGEMRRLLLETSIFYFYRRQKKGNGISYKTGVDPKPVNMESTCDGANGSGEDSKLSSEDQSENKNPDYSRKQFTHNFEIQLQEKARTVFPLLQACMVESASADASAEEEPKTFPSGQVLGGHKRCHWTGPVEAASSSVASPEETSKTGHGFMFDFGRNELAATYRRQRRSCSSGA